MVQMGETTGNLADSFKAMGEFLEKEKEIVGRVKGALRYPSFVVIAITLAMFVINIKVIPAFEGMFKSLGKDLPLMTKILVATSHFFVDYWYLLAALIVGSIVGVRVALATPHLRIIWDQHKLALPVFGKLMLWSTLARFSRALAVTSRAGVPIVQALPIVGGAVGNMYVEARVKLMQSQIEQGNAIAKAAASINLFPPLVLQMLQIGEETGQLDELVSEVADFYEREVDYIIKNLSAAIEPILILLIGGMVLVLALGIFMPMWSLIDLAKPH
jgi:MSHA biogenesis protein MshG